MRARDCKSRTILGGTTTAFVLISTMVGRTRTILLNTWISNTHYGGGAHLAETMYRLHDNNIRTDCKTRPY